MKSMHRWLPVAAAFLLATAPAFALSPILQELEDTFVRLGEEVRPAVVNIDVTSTSTRGRDVPEDLFRFFGITPEEGEGMGSPIPVPSQGSGFIIDAEGHILTNNHVVRDADPDRIEVTLHNGRIYKAKVIGSDPQTDIAVIKIDADGPLPVAKLGDSDSAKVGQFAIAVGSPQGLQGSFSFGHVTALGRDSLQLPDIRFQNFIQTDAAINLGNSGGPLCNIDGEVIGINIAIVYGANSLGFAIPINTAKNIKESLIADGKVTRGFLGVNIKDASEFVTSLNLPDANGAFVDRVNPDTPAARGGIEAYDVIRKVDNTDVRSATHLMSMISQYRPGSQVQIEVWRDGNVLRKQVTLDEFKDGVVTAAAPKTNELGVGVREVPAEIRPQVNVEEGGVIIERIDPAGPAYQAGLRQNDIIVEIARKPVSSVDSFNALIGEHAKPGSSFLVMYVRGDGIPSILPVEMPAVTE